MAPTPERQHYGVTLAVLLTGALAYTLLQTMVVPALPEIQHDLDTSTTTASFVIAAYLVTAAVFTPIAGRLGDMFGKKRTLVVAYAILAIGCLVAALSHSIEMLIAGRAIQGIGGAVFPLAFGIIRDEFPRERVATGIALISATFGIGGAAGLVVAGPIVDNLAYEWIFWLALVPVIIATIATHFFVPESPVKSPARIDWLGALLLSGGLVSLLVAVSRGNDWGWGSSQVLGLLAASAVVLAVWGRHELQVRDPLVDMRLMRERPMLTTNLTAFLVGFGMVGSFILIPQFVQMVPAAGFGFDASVTDSALFMLPSSLAMLVAAPFSGWLSGRVGSKPPVVAGALIAGSGFAFLGLAHGEPWTIYVGSSCQGAGIGLSLAALANLVVEAVDQHQTGVATGVNTVMRTTGGAIGAQVTASILAGSVVASNGLPAESSFTAAFLVGAAGMGVAALMAVFGIPGRPRPERSGLWGRSRRELPAGLFEPG